MNISLGRTLIIIIGGAPNIELIIVVSVVSFIHTQFMFTCVSRTKNIGTNKNRISNFNEFICGPTFSRTNHP